MSPGSLGDPPGGVLAGRQLTQRLLHSVLVLRGPPLALNHKPKKKVVVLATATVTLAAGQSKIVTISLNRAGRRLLSRRHKLKVRLVVTQSGKTIVNGTFAFKTQPKNKH